MTRFLRRCAFSALAAVFFVTQIVTAGAFFDDLYIEDPNFKAIVFLRSLGIVEGYADNTFRSDQPVTRGELAKLLSESLRVRPDSNKYRDCFQDVAREWFAPYVCYLKNANIVRGVTREHFMPASKVTRAEATKMVLAGFDMDKELPVVTQSLFKDVRPSEWFAGYMHRALLDNMLPSSEYAFPNDAINRGMASELLYRAMLIDLLGMPAFDEASADQFLKEQFDIDLSNESSTQPDLDDESVQQQLAIYSDVISQLRTLHPNGGKALRDYVYASMEGLAKEVGDPYTLFLRPQESQDFTNELNGELTGIGVEIAENTLGAMILNVMPDSPAKKGGLKPGDIVTKVDDTVLAGLDSQSIVRVMRGEENTKVTLTILREQTEMSMTLTRAKLIIPSAIGEAKNGIEVIRLTQFGQDTAKELRDVLTSMPADTRGIVLDLRNNGGGYIESAQAIAGFFLPTGSNVFSVVDAQGNKEEATTTGAQLTTLPMAVLVNGYSASAAEVVAGALRDTDRATLVGEKTFGKGTVQTLISYSDGSMLRVTIAGWFTPKGVSVGDVNGAHNGLEPSTMIKDDPATPADEQLDAALTLLP